MKPMDPIDRAGWDLRALDELIGRFRREIGRHPHSAAELSTTFPNGAACVGVAPTYTDPWGRQYAYNKRMSGFELFSNGPDGVPYTNDDVMIDAQSDKCWEMPYRLLPPAEIECHEWVGPNQFVGGSSVGPCFAGELPADDHNVKSIRSQRGCLCSLIGVGL